MGLVVVFSLSSYAIEEKQYDSYSPGVPSYTPEYWNKNSYICTNNNCYNYACNKRTDTIAQPGRAGGHELSYPTVEKVTAAVLRDGLEKGKKTGTLEDGKARVAVYLSSFDYHWYRQDSNGYWSHKASSKYATNYDDIGQKITDIEKADRGNYKTLVGYFYVDSDTDEGKGHENIR